MTSRRFLAALVAAAAAALAALAPVSAAHAAPLPQAGAACSASYLDGDYRLGPATTPDAGSVGLQLFGYSRLADLTPAQFIARYWDSSADSWNQLALKPGSPLDRYGSVYGGYLAPAGTPYWARSLPPSNLDDATGFTCNYHTYKVLKAFKVEAGPATPAFGQPCLGLQYQLVASLLPGDPPLRRSLFGKGCGVEAQGLLEHLPGADVPVRELTGSDGQARLPEGVLVQHQALHDAEQCARIAAELTAAGCHARQVGLLPGAALAVQQVRHHVEEFRTDTLQTGPSAGTALIPGRAGAAVVTRWLPRRW